MGKNLWKTSKRKASSKRPRSKSLDREYKSSETRSSNTSSDVDIIPFSSTVEHNNIEIRKQVDENEACLKNEAKQFTKQTKETDDQTLHNTDININFQGEENVPEEPLSGIPAELDTKVLMKDEIQKILADSSITNPTNIKSLITCNYYTTEITVKKNDVVRIIYRQDDFVYVKNKKGASGFIPLSYCTVESNEDSKDEKKRKWSLKDRSKSKCDTAAERSGSRKKEKGKLKRDKDSEKKTKKDKLKIKQDVEESSEASEVKSKFYVEHDELRHENIDSCHSDGPTVQMATTSMTLHDRHEDYCSVVPNDDQDNQSKDDRNDVAVPLDIELDSDDHLNQRLELNEARPKTLEDTTLQTKQQNVDQKNEYCDTSSEQSEKIEKQESGFSEISESTTDISETNQEHHCKVTKLKNDKGAKKLKELILKKRKYKKNNTDKKLAKSKNSASTKLSVFTESQLNWYSNLFNDDISDSSDSGDEIDRESTTDAESNNDMNKSTRLRFEIQKQEFVQKMRLQQRRVSDTSASSEYFKPLQTKSCAPVEKGQPHTTENPSSSGGFATIRKTREYQTAEVPVNGLHKNRLSNSSLKKKLEKEAPNKIINDDLLHSPLMIRKVGSPASVGKDFTDKYRPPSSLSSQSTSANRVDQLKLLPDHGDSQSNSNSFSFLPDERKAPLEIRTIPPRPFSSPGKEIMLVSYDFIAADDSEVTILSGQQVEVLKKLDDDWWLLRTQDGREGVAPRTFLAPVPTVPSRKPNLLKTFHSTDLNNTDHNNNNNNNNNIAYKNNLHMNITDEHKVRNPVHLPSKYTSSESPRLAKVTPFVREHHHEQTHVDEFYLYKKQTQNQYTLPPPPSYDQHIMHKQHKDLMDCFYETASEAEYQGPISRTWKSQEQVRYYETSSTPPRLVRRKSFSGRQKRVRFSNELENHSNQSEDHFFVARQYGLDNTQIADEENEVSTWC